MLHRACRNLTMSAVAEVFGTIIEETGRAAAGSHSLKTATSRIVVLQKAHVYQYITTIYTGTNNSIVTTAVFCPFVPASLNILTLLGSQTH